MNDTSLGFVLILTGIGIGVLVIIGYLRLILERLDNIGSRKP